MIIDAFYDEKTNSIVKRLPGGILEYDKEFRPYCYVAKEDRKYIPFGKIEETDRKSIYGEELVKVTVKYPFEIYEIRKAVKTFEADVNYAQRYLIDKYDTPFEKVPLRIMYFDIETNMGLNPHSADKEIVSITWFDSKEKKYHNLLLRDFDNEKTMLETFFREAIKYDLLVAWNGENYDYPYLINRYSRLIGKSKEFDTFRRFTVKLDLLKLYRKMKLKQLESYSLDNVGREELGIEKIKVNLRDIVNNDMEKLKEYNQRDVEIMVKLDKKLHIINYFDELRRLAGCRWESLDYTTLVTDTFFLREAKKEGIVLPTKPSKGESKKIKGAYVYAKPGVYNNVCVLDASALYPSILLSFNMDVKTIIDLDKSSSDNIAYLTKIVEKNIGFRKNAQGFVPKIIKRMIELRKEYKKRRNEAKTEDEYREWDIKQTALKSLINASSYGALLYPRFRLNNPKIGDAIPFIGQKVIKHVKSVIEGLGKEVILVDTDSCFFVGSIEEGKEIQRKVNESFNEFVKEFNIDEHYFHVKFEKFYKHLLINSKKRYAGILAWKEGKEMEKFDVVGLDVKRSDIPHYFKDCMTEMIIAILKGATKEELGRLKTKMLNGLHTCPITDLSYPKGIQKKLDKYSVSNPAQEGSKIFNMIVGDEVITEGAKVRWLYTKRIEWNGRVIRTKSFAWLDEYDYLLGDVVKVYPDYEKIKKNLEQMLDRILKTIGLEGEKMYQETLKL